MVDFLALTPLRGSTGVRCKKFQFYSKNHLSTDRSTLTVFGDLNSVTIVPFSAMLFALFVPYQWPTEQSQAVISYVRKQNANSHYFIACKHGHSNE